MNLNWLPIGVAALQIQSVTWTGDSVLPTDSNEIVPVVADNSRMISIDASTRIQPKISPKMNSLQQLQHNRRTNELDQMASTKFDPEYWAAKTNFPVSRLQMFGRFLKNYDLIGMSKIELIKYLGSPSAFEEQEHAITYCVVSGGCLIDKYKYVRIHFDENEKIDNWCFAVTHLKGNLNTTNVVLATPPKTYELEQPFLNANYSFPVTVPKQ